jgi:3-phosphoshikimate 1-carboxyvinyltransferase
MIMSAIKIELPVSKSLLNRAMIAIAGQGNLKSWLEDNSYIIANGCRDTQLLLNALSQDNSAGESSTHYFQDAGTPCRLYTAFAAANFTSPCQITGNESLNSRSIEPLVTALIEMGADIRYSDQVGFTPIFINAGITEWSDITISAAVSSQFASALLLMAPLFKGDKKLIITDSSHSQAYIEMTVHLLNHLGIETSSINEGTGLCITINGDYRSSNTPIDLEILESDWSSAAFFYPVLLGLPKDATIELLGLKMSDSKKTQDLSLEGSKIKSSQGDSAMCVFGNFLGIETIETEKGILINRHPIEINQTLAFLADDEILDHDQTLRIDLKNNPDLVPALVVGWCILGKSAIISGIHNLRFKECDRILAIQENIKGLGCTLTMLGSVEEDRWILNCSGRFFPAQLHIHTQSDHRIAMAFSALNPWIAALSYTDTACVEKSFPQFWEQLKKCTFD